MWRGVAALFGITLGVVLLASGCGTAASSDPFTGSWSLSGKAPANVVITQAGDGYQATELIYAQAFNALSFKRSGDRLEATIIVKGDSPRSWKIIVERREGSDKLFWTEGGGTMQFSRISDSTALPSASPTAP